MRKLFSLLMLMSVCCFVVGCGGGGGDGHVSDPTPGAEPSPDMEELEDDAAFDDYAKQQGAGNSE